MFTTYRRSNRTSDGAHLCHATLFHLLTTWANQLTSQFVYLAAVSHTSVASSFPGHLLVPVSPNSIRSILSYDLSYDLSPTCRRPGRRQVGDQVSDFFCRKLVTDLSATRSPTFLFVENVPLDLIYLVGDQVPDFFLLKTCRRPGFKQVWAR